MLIANYTIEETGNPPPIIFTDPDTYFEQSHQNKSLVLGTEWLTTVDKNSPITEIRFQCYKPSHGRLLHFKTNSQNQWGRHIVDYVLMKSNNSVDCFHEPASCNGFKSSLVPLTRDASFLSSDPNRIGYHNKFQRLYNHVIFKAGIYNFIMRNDRLNCDDNTIDNVKDSWWKIFLR